MRFPSVASSAGVLPVRAVLPSSACAWYAFPGARGYGPDDRVRPVYPWERGWKDTVLVRTHETVDVLVRFDAYEGRYLLHCHKLEHEDHGMMMNFVVGRNPEEAMRKAELELLYGPICTSSG